MTIFVFNYNFVTLAADGCKWSTLLLSHFTTGVGAPGTHSIGGWIGLEGNQNALLQAGIGA
jgi:hypothetical protein